MAKLAKRTYSLPYDLVERFEKSLPAGDRSAFLARLIGEWLAEREREELRRQVVEGCREMADLYSEIDQEWGHVAEEIWHGIE